ncbi:MULTISPECIES: D-alanyl-D-alanine carboxypeptidase family protein [Thermomonospora]|uniref:Peptidase S11 D-alanyl-D-alanine carboxypeptidase 1 n=1 Tax=Thermomonospora curvata (strain ATCC 19995 / DSM 43183 / JCM 3096 / KCTC 9072 / NBRC 15933 / NCIMB 10081 / Henssen B9) TaxID=471852 RepID=D1A809_THECD|nr:MULTISPECIES: serine hydrolase [Thermomonospora]ACY98531.1 peptidase S11 D-alanyl-D-alanine carboxypeptidase 1 [Thermomonospora curvata DSM 43183]PKK13671.1 MAG: D-alanyl-D-alanine carboxypeptidase [Thermomonospora sp. CIF 1]
MRFMRTNRIIVPLVGATLLISVPAAPAAAAGAGPSGVKARSALLYEPAKRKIRWHRAGGTKRPIGSITKAMTAVVVLRSGKLDRKITIKQKHINYAVRHGGSMAHLRPGDKLTARQLLRALLLPSGCDAAYVLADAYGPGWRNFVKKMNATARALNMKKTHYANFDGLPWPTPTAGYSTALDQTKLANYAFKKLPEFRKIVRTRTYRLKAGGGHRAYTWHNTNRLLGSFKGVNGVKTGYTSAAGYSLLFAATRGKRTLIGAVLNSSTTDSTARFTDAARILSWGFGTAAPSRLVLAPLPPGANVD